MREIVYQRKLRNREASVKAARDCIPGAAFVRVEPAESPPQQDDLPPQGGETDAP